MDYKSIKKIKLIILICPTEAEQQLSRRLRELGARGTVLTRGQGSAPDGIMSLLGFASDDKTMLISSSYDDQIDHIMESLQQEFFCKQGFGIGFSIKADGFAGARMLFRDTAKSDNTTAEQ